MAALAFSLLALACRLEDAPRPGRDGRGPLAPEFTLPDLLGSEFSLAEHRGQPVIVDFFATWCAPCVQQIPVLNAFQAAHYGDVVVLGIAVDAQGSRVVGPWVSEYDVQYPVLLGSERLAQQYGAFGFPTLYVIAPDGSVSSKHVGVISQQELEEALAAASAPSKG
jgi:thiol-disulfide isomerase/thioredoxin